MGLDLSAKDSAALENRTEGWIAGPQLAAISMQGRQDVTGFIRSFTGSHHFVLDYLVEEVLGQQSDSIQAFMLQTAILDRLNGPLCDAVRGASCKDTGQEGGSSELRGASGMDVEHITQARVLIAEYKNDRAGSSIAGAIGLLERLLKAAEDGRR